MKIFSKIKTISERKNFPLIAIKDMVLFPHSSSPIYVQKNAALQSIEQAMGEKRNIILAYYNGEDTRLTLDNLNEYATLARIVQVMKVANNNSRVMLEGIEKLRLIRVDEQHGNFKGVGEAVVLDEELNNDHIIRMQILQENFRNFARENKRIPREMLQAIDNSTEPHALMDQILSQITIPYQKKLSFLNNFHTLKRMDNLVVELESVKKIYNLREDISRRIKKRMETGQREFVINEQIKELNKELGKDDDDAAGIRELEKLLMKKELPEEVQDKATTELKRLKRLQAISPEAGILRGYLEWITSLPWEKQSEDRINLDEASRILNEDHYNMEEPKNRILDFLAVLQMKQDLKGPILCFIGPPGTGKTSLGKSLARAMKREFARVSLGGIRDEAEIRGHRRTYVGALPGKIVQGIKRAGTSNPVFLLDEIDKLGTDHRGDPASALLEVLDPEQNKGFIDHYMEIPVDLSRVLFITTANSIHSIPYPLLDRMEIIQIPGYTGIEKLKIAEGFIIPRQLKEHGLEWADIRFSKNAISTIINNYTRESGVRNLEREIAKAIRKITRMAVDEGKIPARAVIDPPTATKTATETAVEKLPAPELPPASDSPSDSPPELPQEPPPVLELPPTPEPPQAMELPPTPEDLPELEEQPEFSYQVGIRDIKKLLGTKKFDIDLLYKDIPAGLVYGMAWTELGGKLLPVEAIILKKHGEGEMILTGSLGDVMKESARIGLSVARKIVEQGKIIADPDIVQNADIHIHVPEGAIPKDGPSAGLTLTLALLSVFSGKSVQSFTSMTGEITLTGRVLAVGGIKEKILAAHRNAFTQVLLPVANKTDCEKLPAEVTKSLKLVFVEDIAEAIAKLGLTAA